LILLIFFLENTFILEAVGLLLKPHIGLLLSREHADYGLKTPI